jgi:hypothetical protein
VRKAGAAEPDWQALTATDDGRGRRASFRDAGTLQLYWHHGQLVLCRGDVTLIRAPLAGPPQEVLFDGHIALHGIEAIRCQRFPDPPAERPIVFQTDRPADLEWDEHLGKGARLEETPDGALYVSATEATEKGWVTTPLPGEGPREVLLELDGATPGAGVFLGRDDADPSEIVRVVNNRRGSRMCVKTCYNDDRWEHDFPVSQQNLVPYVDSRLWVRMLFGCGMMRWWISCDGRHWAETDLPWQNRPGKVTSIGLHHVGGHTGSELTLKRIVVRQLNRLSSLAPLEARQQAVSLPDPNELTSWLTRVTELQPEDVDLAVWRRACAIRTLGDGCARQLGRALLELLLDDLRQRHLPLDDKLAVLDEAALLLDTPDDQSLLERTLRRYYQLGTDAFELESHAPYSSIRRAIMTTPVATHSDFSVVDERLVQAELLWLAYGQKWRQLSEFCEQLRFFQWEQKVKLLDWAEFITNRYVANEVERSSTGQWRSEWRHPLIEELNKAAYNTSAELQSILDSGALRDAARIISSLDADSIQGVTPAPSERNLLVSLRTAIRIAMDRYPQLKTLINEKYGPVATLRVRQAIHDGDDAALRLAAVQFPGTEAVAEAQQWLGDRALTSGWFAQAMSLYQRATESSGPAMRRELAPRMRLAAAMMGQDYGQPITHEVQFGDFQLAADEFEQLIDEMQTHHAGAAIDDSSLHGGPVPKLPEPTVYRVEKPARLDGDVGNDPRSEVIPGARGLKLDWVGWQLAVVTEQDMMYVSNRFQVAAYNLKERRRVWRSERPHERMLRAQEWGLIRMRPLLAQRFIYTRMLYDRGPVLVCLERSNGKVAWIAPVREPRFIVSDPLFIQGQLMALVLTRLDHGENLLQLAVFDRHTGHVLRTTDLLRLDDVWWQRRCCEVTAGDDGLIAALGGVALCCDAAGDVLWVRSSLVLPPMEEPRWVTQTMQPPLLLDDDVLIAQPGVREIQCLEAATGRRRWSLVLPAIRRLIGAGAERLVVQTDGGLLSIDRANGRKVWFRRLDHVLNAAVYGPDSAVLIACNRRIGQSDRYRPHLLWLDPQSGGTTATVPLGELEDADPRLGPLLVCGDRCWSFYGRGHDDATRDVLELVPGAPAAPVAAHDDPAEIWTSQIAAPLRTAVREHFPGWTLLGGEMAGKVVLVADWHGERDVAAVRVARGRPCVLARRISIPTGARARLRLRVGGEPYYHWKLNVRFAGEQTFQREITAKSEPQHWKNIQVDLSPFAGRQGWITIEAHQAGGGNSITLHWKDVELVL